MNQTLLSQLIEFYNKHKFNGKGSLSVALHVTRTAIEAGLPLDSRLLKTDKKGQVKGLSKSRIQFILAQYGITKILAAEAGRTSRGSLDNMEIYVEFLNGLAWQDEATLQQIESWWIDKVKEFFSSKPLRLEFDHSKSLSNTIADIFRQAEERQRKMPGATYLGTVLQHLVGAKLELSLEKQGIKVQHHGASVADQQTGREGDFVINESAIHVTTHPTLSLMQKCKLNLQRGFNPIVITLANEIKTGQVLASEEKIEDRLDFLPAENFLAANIYELSGFAVERRSVTLEQLLNHYNIIIDTCETDPSLKISFG